MAWTDLFYEKKPKKETSSVKKVEQPPTVVPTVYTPPASAATVVEYTQHFRDIMKSENERNFPGNDYYEFSVMKSKMTSLPEPQAYVVVFSGLQAAGMTRQKLLDTAQKYSGIVQAEIDEFTSSYNQMYADSVTKLEEQAKKKNEEMNELAQRINQLSAEINTLNQQSMENARKLADKKNAFLMAGNAQIAEIEQEIHKINQYIQ